MLPWQEITTVSNVDLQDSIRDIKKEKLGTNRNITKRGAISEFGINFDFIIFMVSLTSFYNINVGQSGSGSSQAVSTLGHRITRGASSLRAFVQ